jgi:hypothetical protein
MTIYPMILLLIVAGQDKPKPDMPEDRARRAAIVDRIMGEPGPPKSQLDRPANEAARRVLMAQKEALARERAALAIAAQQAANRQQVHVRVMGRQGATSKSITIEQPAPKDKDQDGEVDPPEPVAPMRLNLNDSVLERENFDRWIFGDGFDEEGRRLRLQTLLSERIDHVMKDHDINRAQLQKLRLAGSGDIKRFLDRVEERRPEFEVARKNFNTGFALLQELEPLSTEFQEGPLGADSFFAKTLKKIESDAKGAPKDER